jgi:hypothetical protein
MIVQQAYHNLICSCAIPQRISTHRLNNSQEKERTGMNRYRVSGVLLVLALWFTTASFIPLHARVTRSPSSADMGLTTLVLMPATKGDAADSPVGLSPVAQSGWGNWEAVPGAVLATSAPSVTTWSRDRLEVFVRGDGSALLWQTFAGGKWSGWRNIGGGLASAPACAAWEQNRMSCFALRQGSSAVWHIWWNGERWSEWQNLGGIATSAPAAVSWGAQRVAVFVRGSDNKMYQAYYDGQRWISWISHEGILTSAPACTVGVRKTVTGAER